MWARASRQPVISFKRPKKSTLICVVWDAAVTIGIVTASDSGANNARVVSSAVVYYGCATIATGRSSSRKRGS